MSEFVFACKKFQKEHPTYLSLHLPQASVYAQSLNILSTASKPLRASQHARPQQPSCTGCDQKL